MLQDITQPELGPHSEVNQSFEQWLLSLGKSPKTAKNYRQALEGSISQWAIDAGLITAPLSNAREVTPFLMLEQQIRELEIFKSNNARGKGMYSAALKQYGQYLLDTSGQFIAEDLQQITSNTQITQTEKTTLINARVGQGKFRQQLIEQWQGCAVTGFKNSRLLMASHIKPWRASDNQERLDPYNGLLLLPNLDKAFDLGFISFSDKGRVLISEELESSVTLGIEPTMCVALNKHHQDYLAYHREVVYQVNNSVQ